MKHILVYGMTSNPGGIETYLHNFFSRVQGNGVMLDFISDFDAISGAEQLQARGARLHFIPAKSKDLWGHLKGMWCVLRQNPQYKTVYFNILDAGAVFTMLPAFLLGRRIVVHSHNNDTDKKRLHKLTRPLLNLITYGRAACSQEAAVHMFGRKAKHALFIPNMIDADKYRFCPEKREQKRQELGLSNQLTLCHVGRLSPEKNPLFLADILKAVQHLDPDAQLLSVGAGPLSDQLDECIQQAGLCQSFHRLGVRSDVPDILQAADVFLLPSLFEGLPISLIEAQAAGLPCMISDVISQQATITDLVCPLSVTEAPEVWAQEIIEASKKIRKDTKDQIIRAGFDSSCCESCDAKLLQLF